MGRDLPWGLEHRVISFALGHDRPSRPDEWERVVDFLDLDVRFVHLPDGVDGLTRYENGRTVVELSPSMSEGRTNFTLAHELGHVLIDQWRERSAAPGYLPSDARSVEMLCDRIGSELLMPHQWLKAEASTFSAPLLAGIQCVAQQAGVTTSAAATRLASLGYPLAIWDLWHTSSASTPHGWSVVRARGRHGGYAPPQTALQRLKHTGPRHFVTLQTCAAPVDWRQFEGPAAQVSGRSAIVVATRRTQREQFATVWTTPSGSRRAV